MICNVCKSNMKEFVAQGFKLHECSCCGLTCKDYQYKLNENEEFNRYKEHVNEGEDYLKYQSHFYAKIRDYLGGSSLDFGCGNNHILSNVLDNNGVSSYYYDKYFYPNNDYKNRHFDSIILEEVIEHLNNPFEVLSELKNNLNYGGCFIIRTRLKDKEDFNSWWYLRDSTHLSFFSLKTFEVIASKLNLNVRFTNNIDIVILG